MRVRAVVAATMLLAACRGTSPSPAKPDASQPKPAERASTLPLLVQRLADVHARRVLALDRRVTHALLDLAKLLGTTPCLATDQMGVTTIACDGSTLVELPALPEWEPLHELLGTVAARAPAVPAGTPSTSSTEDWLVASGGLSRTRDAERRWARGERTSAVALDGLHGLLATLLAEDDVLGLSDSIASRSFALLAIAERSGPRPLEAALLAHVLGYEVAAKSVASTLPAEVLRDYLTRPQSFATETERATAPTPLALYLAHRTLLHSGEHARARALRARMPPALAVAIGVQVARIEAPRPRESLDLGPLLPLLALDEARETAGQPVSTPDASAVEDHVATLLAASGATDRTQTLKQLSATVTAIGEPGAFLSGGVLQDHFRSLVGASDDVYRAALAEHVVVPELDEVALGRESSVRPAEYAGSLEWLRYAATLALGRIEPLALPQLMRTASFVLPPAPLEAELRIYWPGVSWLHPAVKDVAEEVRRHADSRPADRRLLAAVALHRTDLVGYYALGRSWQAAVGPRASKLAELLAIGDARDAEVHARLADERQPRAVRLAALDALEEAKRVVPADRKVAATLLSSDSATADDVARATALLAPADARAAERMAHDWMAAHANAEDTAKLRTELAKLEQLRGDPRAARKTLEPVLRAPDDEVSHRAALVDIALGDADGAVALVAGHMQVMPSWTTITNTVDILVRLKRFDDAAKLLVKPPVPLRRKGFMDYVSWGLADALKDEATVIAFVEALRAASFNAQWLQSFALPLGRIGRPAVAAALLAQIRGNASDAAGRDGYAYRWVAEARGSAAADAWARRMVPPEQRFAFAATALTQHALDPIFDVVPDPIKNDEQADAVWLFRIAGLRFHRELTGPRWQRVMDHYKAAHVSASYYDTIGRYLAELEPESKLLAIIDTDGKVTEAGTYLAAMALSEGRGADALDWFQVALYSMDERYTEWLLSEGITDVMQNTYLGPEQLGRRAVYPGAYLPAR